MVEVRVCLAPADARQLVEKDAHLSREAAHLAVEAHAGRLTVVVRLAVEADVHHQWKIH